MRRLVVNHQAEWLVLVAAVQIFDGMVGNQVGGVTHLLLEVAILSGRSERRVVILTLVIQYAVVIKALRTARHVPLTYHGSRISGTLQQF